MLKGKNVTWFPSYGAEMRGGTANCTVIISNEIIGSPIVRNPDILIAMNEASIEKFQTRVKKNGLLLLDSSMIKKPSLRKDILCLKVPASKIAASLGNAMSANMVLCGALLSAVNVPKEEYLINALEELTPAHRKNTIEINKIAIKKGRQYLSDTKGKNKRHKDSV